VWCWPPSGALLLSDAIPFLLVFMRFFTILSLGLLGFAQLSQPVTAQTVQDVGLVDRPVHWAQSVPGVTVENLHRVTPVFYRSAQFSQDYVAQLQKLGIKTVISFRAFNSDDKLLMGSGIGIARIPINTWDIDDDEVVQALKALRQAEREEPFLIYCQHGADRTGLISALYLVLYQGWSKEQALDEVKEDGYGFHSLWRNIPRYMNDVDIDALRLAVDTG
jgi:protein tyrosine/serine phosphatase